MQAARALAQCGFVLLACLLIGMLWRRKAAQCVTFTLYVAAAIGFGVYIFSFPRLYTPAVFLVKQATYDSLMFGMAIELSFRTFGEFRGVAEKVKTLLGLLVFLSMVAVLALTPKAAGYDDLLRFQPGITLSGIWGLTFIALLIVWYQIPVPAFTKAVILGYVPMQLMFVVLMDLIARLGWGAIDGLNLFNAASYDVVAGYWVYAAWRDDDRSGGARSESA